MDKIISLINKKKWIILARSNKNQASGAQKQINLNYWMLLKAAEAAIHCQTIAESNCVGKEGS